MLKRTRLLFTAASFLLPLAMQAFAAADTSRIPKLTACISRADGSQLLDISERSPGLPAGSPVQVIQLDSSRRYQTISGFGYTLTGASALLIAGLPGGFHDFKRRCIQECQLLHHLPGFPFCSSGCCAN